MVGSHMLMRSMLALAVVLATQANPNQPNTNEPSKDQAMPATAGETLTGKRVVLADEVRGHVSVVVAGFSQEGGKGTGPWVKSLRGDSAMGSVTIYQMAMLEGAPSFVRGMIKSSMKKGVAPSDQDHFVVLTQDEKLWRTYFDVSTDRDPYVVLIDAAGKMLWHGHGAAEGLEPQLRGALR